MLGQVDYQEKQTGVMAADFTQNVEIRPCTDDVSRGRGLFTTKIVKAGDLILAEKAFACVTPPNVRLHRRLESVTARPIPVFLTMKDQLVTKTFERYRHNPSYSQLSKLYVGKILVLLDCPIEQPTKAHTLTILGQPNATPLPTNPADLRNGIKRIVDFNAFAFVYLTKNAHREATKDPDSQLPEYEHPQGCFG